MDSFVYLGFLFLFWSASHVRGIPVVDESSLAVKVEAILRNTDTTVHGLDKINVRINAIEAAIRKLGQLSEEKGASTESCATVTDMLAQYYRSLDSKLDAVLKEVKGLSSVSNGHGDIDEIVQLIRSGHFDQVDEKLVQLGDAVDIPKIVDRLYGNCENNFELLVDFSKGASNIAHRYEILNSLYEQMKVNGHHDTCNLIILTETLDSQVVNQNNITNDTKLKAVPIVNELKSTIETVTTEFLISGMEQRPYFANHEVQELAGTLATHLPKLSDKVMKSLVDGTYEKLGALTILNNLNALRNTSQALSGITALYWKVKEGGNNSSSLMLDLAYNLARLEDRRDFAELSAARKDALESVKLTIPTCARNLFFATNVCLWNVGASSNLIVSTGSLNRDIERRNIFTAKPYSNESFSPFGATWSVEKVGEKIFFKSFDYAEEYLYAALIDESPNNHYVFTWIPGRNTDDQSAWTIELDGDHCLIKSTYFKEYLYASDKEFYGDNQYSYVFTWKPGTLEKNDKFVWQVRNC